MLTFTSDVSNRAALARKKRVAIKFATPFVFVKTSESLSAEQFEK